MALCVKPIKYLPPPIGLSEAWAAISVLLGQNLDLWIPAKEIGERSGQGKYTHSQK
jgi:hypothetical protein